MADLTDEEKAEFHQAMRDALPPMSDEDWRLACQRIAARMRGEPHVHTRLCACEDKPKASR